MKNFRDVNTRNEFVNTLIASYGDTVHRDNITKCAADNDYPTPYFIFSEMARVGRGVYHIVSGTVQTTPSVPTNISESKQEAAMAAPQVTYIESRKVAKNTTESFVPEKSDTYVPFGFYSDLKKVLTSKIFYPVYITGFSGNGKTFMVEQGCVAL